MSMLSPCRSSVKSWSWSRSAAPVLLVVVAACSLAPKYVRPTLDVPDAFKETTASAPEGSWKVAQPAEQSPRGEWWTVFSDLTLNDLEHQAADANQDLKSAAARVKEARALNQTTRSERVPAIGAGFGPTLERQSPASQFLPDSQNVSRQTLWRSQVSASYEVDLFGRVSDSVEASNATVAQSEALFRSLQLALRKRPAKSGVSSIRGQVVPSYAEAIRRSYRPAVSAAA